MKKFILTSTAITLLASSFAALADYGDPNSFINDVNNNTGPNGWLLSGSAGAVSTPDQKFTDKTRGGSGTVKYKWGYNGGLAVGYKYMNWRLEGETGYIYNQVKDMTDEDSGGSSYGATHVSGNTHALTYLLNLYFDFNTNTGIVPFIGIGGGGALVNYDSIKGTINGVPVKDDEQKNVLAYQGIVGLGYQITHNLRIAASYHYFDTRQTEFNANVHAGGQAYSEKVKTTYQTNLANIGITYFFA